MAPFESNIEFTADNWDALDGKEVKECFGVVFNSERNCFFVTLFYRQFRFFLFSYLFRAFCIVVFWVIMFCMLSGKYFSPGTLYFDTMSTILFAGLVGTLGAYVVQVPTIVGVIWAGILWNNAPYVGRLTSGINTDMRQFVSTLGLAIGVLRAGLSLNVIRFKQKFKHYMIFALVPACAEMVVHGVVCHALFHYDSYKIAFAEGFLVSCIAPSVIVPTIIAYQKRGYGVRDGPPMMILCSVAFDTALCIWGIQFLLALEFQRMSTTVLVVLAPVQVLIGMIGGVLLGVVVFLVTFCVLFMEGERLPAVRNDRQLTLRHNVHVRYFSILFMVLIVFCEMAIGRRFNCLGGGAVGVVCTAGTFNFLCVRGGTRDHLRVKADMAQSLTTVWDYFAMPALFGLSGSAVNVHELFDRSFIGSAFALVFIGLGTRFLAALAVPIATRLGLTWKEMLFVGVGWLGKGSIQGALGSTCLQFAADALATATTAEETAWAQQRRRDGTKMKNVAILSVLVACPICSIFLSRLTGKLLRPGT
ncbi:Na+/H+ exchanger domain containing 2 [Strigomonas culicis]|nr:Na+/H+ exchanger domain containing 2 [Strigomonas culicis]|eukprot:EPY33015.1 Na+/H+ exchanger domain containing 2 [Strigomonas culicis]